jgi:hypothetical protein
MPLAALEERVDPGRFVRSPGAADAAALVLSSGAWAAD